MNAAAHLLRSFVSLQEGPSCFSFPSVLQETKEDRTFGVDNVLAIVISQEEEDVAIRAAYFYIFFVLSSVEIKEIPQHGRWRKNSSTSGRQIGGLFVFLLAFQLFFSQNGQCI